MHGALLRFILILTTPEPIVNAYVTVPRYATPVVAGGLTGLAAVPDAVYAQLPGPLGALELGLAELDAGAGLATEAEEVGAAGGCWPHPARARTPRTAVRVRERRGRVTRKLCHTERWRRMTDALRHRFPHRVGAWSG